MKVTARIGRIITAGVASLGIAGGLMITASPASAATARNGVCESGEFCLYYYPNMTGSVSDFSSSVSNYGDSQPTCYEFRGPGLGQGQCVKNNAMSVRNLSSRAVTVYYNSGFAGASQTFASGQAANLISTLSNNNASHLFR
ncbi:peptidase inhibitor family I36 protein [Micromonospora sp. NPDC049559]|uniref:peptidase inhibitor family I36 protein n=1 Tax=Micromonospora sp. NPDC049559 TaxID=3155923 RepID=UPI0034479BDA